MTSLGTTGILMMALILGSAFFFAYKQIKTYRKTKKVTAKLVIALLWAFMWFSPIFINLMALTE